MACHVAHPRSHLKLIIQVPAFNEEATLERTIRELPRRVAGFHAVEVLVIDDGSTDATADVAKRAGADHVVRLLSNRGLATAFVTGIHTALRLGADVIVNTDADNQYVASDIPRLVEPIVAGRADVVIGDRDVQHSPYMSPLKKLLQKLGSRAVEFAAGIEVGDATSGFRAFSREAALQLNVFNPFTYTLETIIQAGNRNLQVESVKIRTNPPTRNSRLYRGITTYVRKSVVTIFRIYTLYKPLKTFFAIGAALFLGGVLIGARFVFYYFQGDGGGHIQSLILAAVLLLAGFQTALIGLVADLISVNRRLTEEVVIRLRRAAGKGRESVPQRRRDSRRRIEPAPTAETPTETQWVWLVDEKTRDEEVAPVPADKASENPERRKRRRRRPERRFRPRETHPPDKPEDPT